MQDQNKQDPCNKLCHDMRLRCICPIIFGALCVTKPGSGIFQAVQRLYIYKRYVQK